jgi:hypothetical protein
MEMNHKKSAVFLSLLLLGASLAALAKTSKATAPATSPQTNEPITAIPGSAPLVAELETSLDSKKAKVGDRVTAHTIEALKADGKILVPKNTKLLGHITESSARSKGDPSSTLAIQFDQAVIKKGEEIPIKLMIQAIAAAPHYSAGTTPDLDSMPSGTAAAQGSPMGASRQSPTGMSQPAPTPTPRPDSNGSSPPYGDRNAGAPNDGSEGLDSSGRLTPKSRGVIGLDGVHLATDETSFEKGSLITASGKSLRLDAGVRLLLISQ